jgi:hypothetical protein
MTGRIIDADVVALANIDRLTAQVARLTSDRDAAYRRIEADQKDINELASGFARLQESLTACEQQRDDFKRIVEVWRKRHGGAEDRVRALERSIERIDFANRQHEDVIRGANGFTRTIRDVVIAALNPAPPAASHTLDCNEGMTYGDSCSCAPPAETPAPTCGFAGCNDPEHQAPVSRDASVDVPADGDYWEGYADGANALGEHRARLRAELAAAKKRADEFAEIIIKAAELNASKDRVLAAANEEIARLHASMKLQRDATKKALDDRDATTAQLGRAAVVLRGVCDAWDEGDMTRGANARRDAVAILADADGTQAAAYVRALDAAVAAARFAFKTGTWPKAWHDAIAAVDARRGAVAK